MVQKVEDSFSSVSSTFSLSETSSSNESSSNKSYTNSQITLSNIYSITNLRQLKNDNGSFKNKNDKSNCVMSVIRLGICLSFISAIVYILLFHNFDFIFEFSEELDQTLNQTAVNESFLSNLENFPKNVKSRMVNFLPML